MDSVDGKRLEMQIEMQLLQFSAVALTVPSYFVTWMGNAKGNSHCWYQIAPSVNQQLGFFM